MAEPERREVAVKITPDAIAMPRHQLRSDAISSCLVRVAASRQLMSAVQRSNFLDSVKIPSSANTPKVSPSKKDRTVEDTTVPSDVRSLASAPMAAISIRASLTCLTWYKKPQPAKTSRTNRNLFIEHRKAVNRSTTCRVVFIKPKLRPNGACPHVPVQPPKRGPTRGWWHWARTCGANAGRSHRSGFSELAELAPRTVQKIEAGRITVLVTTVRRQTPCKAVSRAPH
jgi:hypothetical protein